jgi:HD-GYP domain-containing protein (c-di-GMP phosphodiesterase class II)
VPDFHRATDRTDEHNLAMSPASVSSARSSAPPARAEVLAALSVAIDLGLGQPAEHMLRSAVIACRLADRLGLSAEQRGTVYYTTLVMWIGCHADSQEYARWFGDDIAVRTSAYLVDWSGLPYMKFLMGNVARGEPPMQRAKTLATLFKDAKGQLGQMIHSHCASATALATHFGLSDSVQRALAFTFERYDGGGMPTGCSGGQLPVEMRVAQIADMAEVHCRLYGTDGAVAMVRSRRGGQFDPKIADAFVADAQSLLAPCADGDAWAAAMECAPDRDVVITGDVLDDLLIALGDFADLKCPFMLGHSRGVAELASAAGRIAGLTAAEVSSLRRAGYLHDVGRLGVSNQVWSKPGPLTADDWERVRMHPYLGGRVLSRIRGLAGEAGLVRSHHERPDGSGYPLGLDGAALGRSERLLAAAVTYQSALEPRPYRDAMTPTQAAARVNERMRAGQVDAEAGAAVVTAAGHRPTVQALPAGLTRREVEILGLVARGLSNRQIAETLVLSEKTVRNHVERTYTKIGATNRVGASLYALSRGFAGPVGAPR